MKQSPAQSKEANNGSIHSDQRLLDQIRSSREILSTVFYKSPVISSITDATTGRMIEVNDKFVEFCGVPKGEIIGRTSMELGMIIDPERRLEIIEQVRKNGSTADVVMRIRAKNENRWVSTSAHLLNIDGREYFLTAMVDVTERMNAELQLAEANKELESFCYSISHDLRAPLRAIDGYSRILIEENSAQLDEEGKRLMNVITNNTTKMANLIDNLLSFSRMGKQPMVKVKVNLDKLVRSTTEEVRRLAVNKDTRVIFGELPEAECDSSMIRLVFNHLLSNAFKFSGKVKEPVVEVGTISENEETIYYVKDNGAGFDMNYYDKLFGVFQRLHSAVEFEGTGVGLALAQRILVRHGGRIWAESIIDKGAAFYFTLTEKKHTV